MLSSSGLSLTPRAPKLGSTEINAVPAACPLTPRSADHCQRRDVKKSGSSPILPAFVHPRQGIRWQRKLDSDIERNQSQANDRAHQCEKDGERTPAARHHERVADQHGGYDAPCR